MGCCHSNDLGLKEGNFALKVKEAIDLGSTNGLASVFSNSNIKRSDPMFIDREIVRINEISFNALGYSLFLGKTQIFKFLYKTGASIKAMEDLLRKNNLRAINLICYKGYKDLLEFYLPIYLHNCNSLPQSIKSYTIDLKDTQNKPEFDLPIHSACRAGMINIVFYLYTHFKHRRYCPKEFSIHTADELNGEDSPLIACRTGCYQLIKFFYEICQVNYTQLNAYKENAIMICVSGYNKSPSFTFLDCLEYLIRTVGVDVCYRYEELLCMVEGKEMIEFVERELEKNGIGVKKKDLEEWEMKVKVEIEGLDSMCGTVFDEEMRKSEKMSDLSVLSTISAVDQRSERPLSDFFNCRFE